MRCHESLLSTTKLGASFSCFLLNKKRSSNPQKLLIKGTRLVSYIAFSFNIASLIIFVVRKVLLLYIWHINHENVKTIAKFHQLSYTFIWHVYFIFIQCNVIRFIKDKINISASNVRRKENYTRFALFRTFWMWFHFSYRIEKKINKNFWRWILIFLNFNINNLSRGLR